MTLDPAEFFRASIPTNALVYGDPRDRRYYIDFSTVRDSNIVGELERSIRYTRDRPTCQLFTGHIGCGKSTELLRLKYNLEQADFHVVYFESDQDLDIGDVDVSDVMLMIASRISASLETLGIRVFPPTLARFFAEIGDRFKATLETTEISPPAGFSVQIGKLLATTKDSPSLRDRVHEYMETRIGGMIDALNNELLTPAIAQLQKQGKQGLVVLIDNLDRLDPVRKPSGRSQAEYLFVDRGEQLKKLHCHVVYTIPLPLVFSNDLGPLINRFGMRPKVLPMVPVRRSEGTAHAEGLALLRQMVLARAFPDLNPYQRLAQLAHVFDQADTLERLCTISGGHARNLMVLLHSCLQRADPPIQSTVLESVIRGFRDDLVLTITDDQWQLLNTVNRTKAVSEEPAYQALLRSLYVFEYRDDQRRWFDVNPALRETPQMQALTSP